MGSGSPFMATASSASRPSMIADTGDPHVQPSAEVLKSCVAPGCTPASSSRSASRAPRQTALPTSEPPTSFDTHDSVTSRSIIGRARRSAKVSSSSRSTIPCTFSRQWSGETCGTSSAVSMR